MVVWDLVQVTGFFLVLHDEWHLWYSRWWWPRTWHGLGIYSCLCHLELSNGCLLSCASKAFRISGPCWFRLGSLGDTADRPVHSINETHSSICSKQRIPVNAVLYVPGAGIASKCPAPPGVRYGEIQSSLERLPKRPGSSVAIITANRSTLVE
jgi:hypothetical protein